MIASVELESIAFLDGQFIPLHDARLPLCDLGVVGGIAVSEMLRTFRHEPFRTADHVDRLLQSCGLVGLPCPLTSAELSSLVQETVHRNTRDLEAADDLGLIVFLTAGWNPTYTGAGMAANHGVTLGIHPFPLQYRHWRDKYLRGVSLRTSQVSALPATVVNRRVKSRSRLHWYCADREVQSIEAGSLALLLDEQAYVTETPAANVCAIIGDVFVTPPEGAALEGISLQVTMELAETIGLAIARRPLKVADLANAREVMVTSTPYSLLPVCRLDGQPIHRGQPGPCFRRLLSRWCEITEVDLYLQACRTPLEFAFLSSS